MVKELAERLHLEGFHPWPSEEAMIDAILDHTCTRRATVAALRAEGGIRALNVSHVANPTLDFDTPSRKIEFYSEQAGASGFAAAADRTPRRRPGNHERDRRVPAYSLAFTQGRTLTHFHSFYNNGQRAADAGAA